jgi:hypothetical protein
VEALTIVCPACPARDEQVKERKGERTVKDPTTGHAVTIKDAEFKGPSARL